MNNIIKFFLNKLWSWLIIWMWIILSVWIFWTIYAYTNLPNQTSGSTLTETIWNDIVSSINDIWNKTNNIYSLWWNTWIWTATPEAILHIAWDLKVDWNRIIRKSVVQVNTNSYSASTSWAQVPAFPTITDFKAGSLVKLSYHIPMRNDSSSWWWGYIEPQISFNWGTTWNSLWSSWYDWWVMNNVANSIGSYFNTILIDPAQSSDYSVKVRFYFRSYDGTVIINWSHDLNNISSTATLMSWVNWTQHFAKIIVEELY